MNTAVKSTASPAVGHDSDGAEIDKLTPENTARMWRNWTRRVPVPADTIALLAGAGFITEGKPVRLDVDRADITIDGKPTTWHIDSMDGEIVWSLDSDLPCSIDWCSGHMPNESDRWDGFHHRAPKIELQYTDDVELEKFEDLVEPYMVEGAGRVYIDIELTGELTPAEASQVADSLRRIATGIEDGAMVAAALELRQAVTA